MAKLDMKTAQIIELISGESNSFASTSSAAANSARGCINQLRGVLDDIKATAGRLNGVWDDDAQKVFMDKFMETSKSIREYLDDLDILFGEMSSAIQNVQSWDHSLTDRLSNSRLGL